MLVGDTTMSDLQSIVFIMASLITVGGLAGVFLIATRISSPITKLAKIVEVENPESLEPITIQSKEETGTLILAINSLLNRISKFQQELHLQNEELRIQKARIERLAEIGEMASRLAHNLRNPISVIRTTVNIINHTYKNPDKKMLKHLTRIDNVSKNMEKQLESVLNYVKDKPLDARNSFLSKIINSAIDNMEVPKEVKITLPDEDVTLNCDPEKLQVVFMNLFTNSIQAMSGRGEIDITTCSTYDELVIKIKDTGLGIPTKDVSKIFDSLFTTKPSGTGLGLAYCKTVVEQHGGKILVSTRPTVFTITLPMMTLSKDLCHKN